MASSVIKGLRTVDFVYLQYCPDDDCSIAVKTVGIKCSLLKDNVWLVYQESLLANYVRLPTESSITKKINVFVRKFSNLQ